MNQEDHDLLQQVHTELKRLRIDFDKVGNGVGYTRCVERYQMLLSHAERIKTIEERITWQDRAIIGALIVLGIKLIWSAMPLPVG